MFNVEGKVIFITGALGGIGRECVKQLLKLKAKAVVITDEDDSYAESFQQEIASEHGCNKTTFIKVDVTNKKEIDDALARTVDIYKQLDVVFCNAGIADEIDYQHTINVNLSGLIHVLFLSMFKYLPKYKSGEEAVFYINAAVAGLTPITIFPVYTATKQALVGLTRSFGTPEHYAQHKVKLVTMCSSIVDTPLTDVTMAADAYNYVGHQFKNMPKTDMLSCEEAAEAILRTLMEGENGSIWYSGKNRETQKIIFPDLSHLV